MSHRRPVAESICCRAPNFLFHLPLRSPDLEGKFARRFNGARYDLTQSDSHPNGPNFGVNRYRKHQVEQTKIDCGHDIPIMYPHGDRGTRIKVELVLGPTEGERGRKNCNHQPRPSALHDIPPGGR